MNLDFIITYNIWGKIGMEGGIKELRDMSALKSIFANCGQWMPESILKKFEKAWLSPSIFHTNLPSANQFEWDVHWSWTCCTMYTIFIKGS